MSTLRTVRTGQQENVRDADEVTHGSTCHPDQTPSDAIVARQFCRRFFQFRNPVFLRRLERPVKKLASLACPFLSALAILDLLTETILM